MIVALLSIFAIFVILMVGEWLWESKCLNGEFGRKFIHISVGTFIAFWPFYMSFGWIRLISLALLLVVMASRQLKVFSAVHTVDRKSLGDILFACGVGLTALLTSSHWIFMAAILHLSLADGLAAIAGKRFGKNHQYKILGYTKSFIGTGTFLVVSLIIVSVALTQGTTGEIMVLPLLIWLPVVTSVIENIGVYGLDNVLVPLLIVLALSRLHFVS